MSVRTKQWTVPFYSFPQRKHLGCRPEGTYKSYLEVGHLRVALLGARVVRQLDVPEAGKLVHQDGVLLNEGVEDVL